MANEGEGFDPASRRRAHPDPRNPLDTRNPQAHANGEIFSIFDALRDEGPVVWNPESQDRGFWAVVGYDEVAHALKDTTTFSADFRNGGNRIFDNRDVTNQPGRMLLALDPPERKDLRDAIAGFFSPARVKAMEPVLQERADRLVGAIASQGSAEFVSCVAAPFSIGLTTDMLGVPESFGSTLDGWIQTLLADDDPALQPSLDVRRKAIEDFDAWAEQLFVGTLKPETGLVDALRSASVGGTRLDFNDFSLNLMAFTTASSDTTRHALTSAVLALSSASQSDRARIAADRGFALLAAREIIRWSTPLAHVRRTAMRDVTLGGAKVRKGDKVVLWYIAANREAGKWAQPDVLNLHRFGQASVTTSLAFGAGPHFCLGWRIAELEVAIMLQTLLRLTPDIQPDGPPVRALSNFIRGIRLLHTVFTPNA